VAENRWIVPSGRALEDVRSLAILSKSKIYL
jgi:hypothetical protein